jgi:methylase of polypeptide subunit release factors
MLISSNCVPLTLDRPDDVRRVRDVLDRVGYDYKHVSDRIATRRSIKLSPGPSDRPRLLRRTRDGDPQATLIRLFLLGVPVPFEAFRRAVAPLDPRHWAALGLVEIETDAVRRRVVLTPFERFILTHDPDSADGHPCHDHVMGISTTTVAFAAMLVRPPAERTLDLGTGNGYLALRAAEHSRGVLATDVNPRAITMARFNAMLNRAENLETAQGSLYEPAGDQRFDLIASNPPFVVSPQEGLMYRDSGLQGDAICERVLRGAPGHLAEGGFAQVICNWVRIAGQDWVERLSGWFDGSNCDVWIVHSYSEEPGAYAQHWLGQPGPTSPQEFAEAFERWMDYYERNRIEAVDAGFINLRRRTGSPNWVRIDRDHNPDPYTGAVILRGFAAGDVVERIQDDGALLAMTLRCRPDLTLSQRLRPSESGWSVTGTECTLDGGLRFEGDFNLAVFHLLTLCRGELPVSGVLEQAAARLGRDLDEIRRECLDTLRSLTIQGFLWPADSPLEPWSQGNSGESRLT